MGALLSSIIDPVIAIETTLKIHGRANVQLKDLSDTLLAIDILSDYDLDELRIEFIDDNAVIIDISCSGGKP